MARVRKWLLSGLLVIVPVAITLWVLKWIVGTLDQTLLILPESWQPDRVFGFHIPGLGTLLAIAVVLAVGAAASNFLGKRLLDWSDALLQRIPVVRSIYTGVKQVSDTLFSGKGNAFRTAVLVQWPHQGMWTIGFVTGLPGGDAANHLPPDCLSIYVPTTPNPTGGYFVMLPRSDCVELNISVDEALKYVISMGVVAPGPTDPAPPRSRLRQIGPD
ncbi:MAG: DUF502 domain-containing protein [Proteobacteria bacterium]|nr:DUF502 domain-containing protein [Pseudomonadota bacterium]